MTNRRSGLFSKLAIGLAVGASLIAVTPAAAQSTIMNIPTTDIASTTGYLEFDYLAQLPKPEFGQFQTFVPRVVWGLSPMVEVGANFSVTKISDGGGTGKIFQPNAKVKLFSDDDKGLAVAAGFIGYIVSDDGDNFGQIYGVVSKKMKSGARVHVGGYGAVSCECDDKGGVILGYEQPLAGKVSFVADFLSGNNFWGYLTPGVSITLPHNGLLNVGYAIGYNELKGDGDPDYRNNAFFAYYGITLP